MHHDIHTHIKNVNSAILPQKFRNVNIRNYNIIYGLVIHYTLFVLFLVI